jgi:hypothetical protein
VSEPFRLAPQEFDPAIPVSALTEHPENYNQGDIGAIHRSMERHGFYGGVIVQRSSGRILAGNHRYRTATQAGATHVPGFWLDVDDDQAEEMLVDDNWSSSLATFDEAQLVALLTRRQEAGRLPATVSADDLDDLLQQLQPPDLGSLGGAGGGVGEKDLWPEIKVRVSPPDRQRFYDLTAGATTLTDEGRFLFLLAWADNDMDASSAERAAQEGDDGQPA